MSDYAAFLAEDERTREEIRSRLSETMLVEAGAGTGKTRSLVDRVVSLVLGGTQGRDDDEARGKTSPAVDLRRVERARVEEVLEVVQPQQAGIAQSQDFSVRGRVAGADRTIAPASYDLIVNYDDRADGNLTLVTRQTGFVQREAHKELIICVGITEKVGSYITVYFSVC